MTYCNKGIRYNSIITIGHLGDVHVLQSSPVCFLVLFINFFYEFETILVLIFFIGRVLLIVKIVKEKSEHGPVVLFSRETSTKIKNLRIPWPVDQKFKCWGGGGPWNPWNRIWHIEYPGNYRWHSMAQTSISWSSWSLEVKSRSWFFSLYN